MQLERDEIDAWIEPLAGKRGAAWPNQRTLFGLLRVGALHRFDGGAHVLVGRVGPGTDAHLITTSRLITQGIPPAEQAFVKDLLRQWAPKTVWVAWLQRDTRMTEHHAAYIDASGLRKVTRKKIWGWAIAVGVKLDDLAALIRGA